MTDVTDRDAPESGGDDLADDDLEPRSHIARNSALVAGSVLVLFVLLLATRQPQGLPPNPLVGRAAPKLAGKTLTGERVDLDSYRANPEFGKPGQWVVVNFLASWCIGCKEEHPDLVRFADEHKVKGDATIVGVAFNDSPNDLRAFFRDFGGDWPVILSDDGRAALDFSVTAVPESFLVAPNGVVVRHFEGVTYEALNETIDFYTRGVAQQGDTDRRPGVEQQSGPTTTAPPAADGRGGASGANGAGR